MWNFNMVATQAAGGIYRRLLEDLRRFGDFRRTEFLGVVLGLVDNREGFLEEVRKRREEGSAFGDLGRLIPVDRTFVFDPENFLERAGEAVSTWLDDLAGSRFYVRLERRGHKGEILSPEVERALDAFILESLEARGASARIDFDDPDRVVVIETIGDRAGVGLLTREAMARYDFVRVG